MSVRSAVLKAFAKKAAPAAGAAEEGGMTALGAGLKRRKKKRKMPPQGSRYDTVSDIRRFPLLPWKFTDGLDTFDQVRVGKNVWMRRSDGIWYKPMRNGHWTSVLSPPKGGEDAFRLVKVKRAVVGTAIGGTAAAGINEMRRK